MKKVVTTIAVLVVFGFIATQVWAWGCGGQGYGHGGGSPGYGGGYSNTNPQAYQKFMDDTADLRTELGAKQAEYDALMRNANPDPKQAGQLSRDMAGIRGQIQAKAKSSGLQSGGTGGYGYCSMGHNCPMGNHGSNYGYRWQGHGGNW